MSGKNLSPEERLCACFLFYFQAGMDTKQALTDGAKRVHVPIPSDDDLFEVMDRTGIGMWKGVMPFAQECVQGIVKDAPRDVSDVVNDVVGTVKRGHKLLEKLTNQAMTIEQYAEFAKKRGGR